MKIKFYLYGALIFCLTAGAYGQSGGEFAVEKSVIAGGGRIAAGGQFALEAAIAQTLAGQRAANAANSVHAGFWNPASLVPTAAGVSVSGRVTTADGRAIRHVRITLTDAGGNSRTALTGSFGYFSFSEVPSGETYVITAVAKRYEFVEPSQIRMIFDDTDNINFVAAGDW